MANDSITKRDPEKVPVPLNRPAVNGPSVQQMQQEYRIEVGPQIAGVIRANMDQVARTNEAADAARKRADLAQENSARLIVALVQQAGEDVEHFMNVNLVEDPKNRKMYLVGMPVQQMQQGR